MHRSFLPLRSPGFYSSVTGQTNNIGAKIVENAKNALKSAAVEIISNKITSSPSNSSSSRPSSRTSTTSPPSGPSSTYHPSISNIKKNDYNTYDDHKNLDRLSTVSSIDGKLSSHYNNNIQSIESININEPTTRLLDPYYQNNNKEDGNDNSSHAKNTLKRKMTTTKRNNMNESENNTKQEIRTDSDLTYLIDTEEFENYTIDINRTPDHQKLALYEMCANNVDPFDIVKKELNDLTSTIEAVVGSDHPLLNACASYLITNSAGKRVRPAMVLLISLAATQHVISHEPKIFHPSIPSLDIYYENYHERIRRLAEITEMIHVASLFHDDVIDEAETRRGIPSANSEFGNKLAVLGGDFLLARACVSLARLRNVSVVEVMSTIIENLVKGEVMQSSSTSNSKHNASMNFKDSKHNMEYYLRKNYYKTGSLMANSCRSAILLLGQQQISPYPTNERNLKTGGIGQQPPSTLHFLHDIAFAYGRHIGLAFQLVDDILDFTASSEALGKPALNDLKQGIATAPVLLALETHGDTLLPLVKRKFRNEGDIEITLDIIKESNSLEKTRELALVQVESACDVLNMLRPSLERDALMSLAFKVLNRKN